MRELDNSRSTAAISAPRSKRRSSLIRCRNSSARLALKRISKRGILERAGQPVDGALRAGVGQDVRDPAPHRNVLLGIEQRVHQLAHRAVRVAQQKGARPLEGLVPGQQPDGERHDDGIVRLIGRQRRAGRAAATPDRRSASARRAAAIV